MNDKILKIKPPVSVSQIWCQLLAQFVTLACQNNTHCSQMLFPPCPFCSPKDLLSSYALPSASLTLQQSPVFRHTCKDDNCIHLLYILIQLLPDQIVHKIYISEIITIQSILNKLPVIINMWNLFMLLIIYYDSTDLCASAFPKTLNAVVLILIKIFVAMLFLFRISSMWVIR